MVEVMTLQEVADYLRVTPKTISRLLKTSSIPASRVGRQWRFDKNLLDAWLRRNATEKRARMLVIDDEETIQILFKETLEELGHTVKTTGTSSEGLQLVEQQDFDLVFLDLKMPGIDGAELFRRIKATKPKLPVTIITGYPDSNMIAQALVQGPFGVMNKPFDESDIIAAINNFLRLGNFG